MEGNEINEKEMKWEGNGVKVGKQKREEEGKRDGRRNGRRRGSGN